MSKYDVLEEAIKKLQERIDKLEKGSVEVTSKFAMLISLLTFSTDLTSRVHVLMVLSPRFKKENAKRTIKEILEDEKSFIDFAKDVFLREHTIEATKSRMDLLLGVAKMTKLSFREMSSLILGIFDIDLAEKIVSLNVLIELYGSANANRWKKLLEGRVFGNTAQEF